jgi:hypothetical protein
LGSSLRSEQHIERFRSDDIHVLVLDDDEDPENIRSGDDQRILAHRLSFFFFLQLVQLG